MGYCYSYIGKEDISITYYQKVLWLIETYNINKPREKALALMNLGTAYVNLDKLILSRNYLLEGIDYCKKNKLLSILLDCYIRISRVHLKLDDIQKSKEQLSKAVSINDSLDDERVKGDVKSLEVFYHIAEEEYDKAILCLKSSIEISKKYNDDFNFYYNIILLIHCFIEMNDIQEAKGIIAEHHESMKRFQFKMISHLLCFEEGIIKLKGGYEKDGMEEMAAAITSLISINEIWEVYRLSKVYANIIIHQDSNTAKKYYNLSMDYFKKLSSME
jgi:tetratricopeptide (TPR) repeat protein